MASVVTRVRADGSKSHFVKYRGGDGRVRWEKVPGDKRAAKSAARKIEEQLERTGGRWTPPAPMAFGDYADAWLEKYAKPSVRPRVFENYSGAVRLHLKPALKMELAAVSRSDVKALVAKMRKDGKADATIRNVLVPLREMLGHAVEDGLIVSNPAAGIRLGRVNRQKVKAPPVVAITALLEEATGDARDAILLAATAGLRRGELFALCWRDVDFAERTIHVHASNYDGAIDATTKTEAGERFVPLFESARKALAARKLRSTFNRPQDLVFGTAVGTPANPGNFVRRAFAPAQKRALAKLAKQGVVIERFRRHALRHFAVTTLIAQHADIKLLQQIAGHASATMTLDVYGHLMTDRVSEAARLYDPLREKAAANV